MRTRLTVALGLIALVAVGVMAFVILEFGRLHPSPPSLRERPNPAIPGEIAYFTEANCVTRAMASGANRSEVCLPSLREGDTLTWVDADSVAVFRGDRWVKVSLITGNESPIGPTSGTGVAPWKVSPNTAAAPDGTVADVDEGGRVFVTDSTGKNQVADFDVPNYRIQVAGWSPDSKWLALRYQPNRSNTGEVWIISRDGSVRGTLATDARYFPWVAWRMDGVGATPQIDGVSMPLTKKQPFGPAFGASRPKPK